MAQKKKRKLTPAEKAKRRQFTTIFVGGKQKRIRRPQLFDGLSEDEFLLQNADPILLHQLERWDLLDELEAHESHDCHNDETPDLPF